MSLGRPSIPTKRGRGQPSRRIAQIRQEVDPTPRPLDAAVSARMRRQKTAGTKPEIEIRRRLHGAGLRYRLRHSGLGCRPDIILTRARIAVFIDGCFWHGCPDHGSIPKNNHQWWSDKLAESQRRDLRNDRHLAENGWLVMRYWEHEDPDIVAEMIVGQWRRRTGRN